MFNSHSDIKHDGITLSLEGTVNLQLSPKNVGIIEAFYNSVKVCMVTNTVIFLFLWLRPISCPIYSNKTKKQLTFRSIEYNWLPD